MSIQLLLDSEDEHLRERSYYNKHRDYWYTRYEGQLQSLHRLINNTPGELDTDHINRNRSDNRKENLRSCTRAENMLNTGAHKDNKYSDYKGVTYASTGRAVRRWRATFKGKHLGSFHTEEEAKEAYEHTVVNTIF